MEIGIFFSCSHFSYFLTLPTLWLFKIPHLVTHKRGTKLGSFMLITYVFNYVMQPGVNSMIISFLTYCYDSLL